jgi:hypothetical protein
MSHGYGGDAFKLSEDSNQVLYTYGVYNYNEPYIPNTPTIRDGSFTIDKSSLVEPEIHTKIKKINGKKKEIIKKIPKYIDFCEIYESGAIHVENSKFCFAKSEYDIDYIAITLITKVYNYYQELGTLPIGVHAMF